MEKRDKRQLEGLLQARSEDMRHGRRPRSRRSVSTPVLESPVAGDLGPKPGSSARSCEGCDGEIGTRRLRAMPRATLCLDCKRSAEQAGTT